MKTKYCVQLTERSLLLLPAKYYKNTKKSVSWWRGERERERERGSFAWLRSSWRRCSVWSWEGVVWDTKTRPLGLKTSSSFLWTVEARRLANHELIHWLTYSFVSVSLPPPPPPPLPLLPQGPRPSSQLIQTWRLRGGWQLWGKWSSGRRRMRRDRWEVHTPPDTLGPCNLCVHVTSGSL